MTSPTQMLPPQNQATSNNIYNNAGSDGLQDADLPPPPMVPMAANDGFGAFGSAF